MPFSAKNVLNDSQIALEKVATDKFGNVVEDFARGGLGGFLLAVDPNAPVNRNDGSWYATSYAAGLAGATNYRPKLKFLFKVEFIFTEAAKAHIRSRFGDARYNSLLKNEFTFMIKSVDRPKIDFEYEEDVNMYNFRTKILKKIRHRDLTVTFMDDAGNRVFDFFRMLMDIHSPISAGGLYRDRSLTKPDNKKLSVGSGMAFNATSNSKTDDMAHRSVVNSQFGNSIEAIRVKQIFIDPQSTLSTATHMVAFDFINPRIISFDLDELSHETNDVNLLTMIFDYDWMEMVDIGALGANGTTYTQDFNVKVPGVHGAPSDITPNKASGAVGNGSGGANPVAGVIGSILGRGAQEITSDLIGKTLGSIGGSGRFSTAIGGIVSSAVSGPIGGFVSGAARERLGGLFSSVQNPNARASAAMVTDSTTSGSDKQRSAVFSSSAYTGSDPAQEA